VRGVTIAHMLVQYYSGAKASERPVRFELQGREFMVEEIVDQWYCPDDRFFKLLADDGNVTFFATTPTMMSGRSSRPGSRNSLALTQKQARLS
jgi:hypothetical protein